MQVRVRQREDARANDQVVEIHVGHRASWPVTESHLLAYEADVKDVVAGCLPCAEHR